MVTPEAKWLEVVRLNHNLGKIHDVDVASFELRYFDASGKTLERTERLDIPGRTFRKEGLGKDVTDKFLAGLPGIQKEGCDGLITSARECEDFIASGKVDFVVLARGMMWNPRFAWHAAEELGAEAPYAPKYMACHPKMRPQIFPNRAQAA